MFDRKATEGLQAFSEWCGHRAQDPEAMYIEYDTLVQALLALNALPPTDQYLIRTRIMLGMSWDVVVLLSPEKMSLPTARKRLEQALEKIRLAVVG